jgi:hypothetical protein
VAAILVLAVAFWIFKHYSQAQVEPVPVAAAKPASHVPQLPAPHPELWGNTDGDPAPAEESSTLEAAPEEMSPQQKAEAHLQEEQARLAQALAASNPQPGSYVIQPSADEIRQARCQAAKDHREATLKQVGLNRSFDLLRQLDEQVYAACKSN